MITTHLQKASGIIQTEIGKVDQAARSQVEQGDEQEQIQKLQHAAGVAANAGFSATALVEGTIRKTLHHEKGSPTPGDRADKVKEITERLEQGIKDLFQSDRYKEYLRVMSRFHNYSFNNSLLISMQNPRVQPMLPVIQQGHAVWSACHEGRKRDSYSCSGPVSSQT